MSESPKLNVEETGTPDGPPLLLIHGFMSSNLQWELNRERLGASHRLLLVEQLGHGGSSRPAHRADYGPTSILSLVDEVRRDRGIDKMWIGGHSLGGAIATRYALNHPDHVEGLIFTNSRAAFGLERKNADPDEDSITAGISNVRDLPFHPVHARRFPPELQSRMIDAADAMPFDVLDNVVGHRDSWASVEEMNQLQIPVLVVNGRWESAFQPCVGLARAAIPQLEVVELEGGHSINIEQAEAFDAAVLAFTGRNRK